MKKFLLLLFIAIVSCMVFFAQGKISTLVAEELEIWKNRLPSDNANKVIEVQILLKEQVIFSELKLQNLNFIEKGRKVFRSVKDLAEITQKPLVELLKSWGVHYQPFYVSNCVFATLTSPEQVEKLDRHPSVAEVASNRVFHVPLETPDLIQPQSPSYISTLGKHYQQPQVEWNLAFVKAPEVWAKNVTGVGFTVANADTGVDWNHPALRSKYRGVSGDKVDHNHNWWDGVRQRISGNRCGYNLTAPCDDNGHGTHTTGTAVGGTPTRTIGVAPGAKWIACRNMDGGTGRPETYIQCLEFFLAPFDLNRQNADPDLRPVSIGNSYGCPTSERCEPNSLKQASDALRAAGVFMSVSAGNSGPSCSSMRDPPAFYESVIAVAASGVRTHTLASFSSRGKVTVDGSNRRKPDITAPGSSVASSVPGGRYSSFSGTSMASPHVNGAVALACQADPDICYDVDKLQTLFERSAYPVASSQCESSGTPNNLHGYGSLDVLKAIDTALLSSAFW